MGATGGRGGSIPVCIPDQAFQMVKVHESEFAHRWLQVQVYDMLPADPLQVLAVTHPCQVVDDLLVPGDLEPIPGHKNHFAVLRTLQSTDLTMK